MKRPTSLEYDTANRHGACNENQRVLDANTCTVCETTGQAKHLRAKKNVQNHLPSCSQARRDLASPFLWLPQWQIGTERIRRMCVIKAIIVCINAPNNHDAVGVHRTNYKSKSIKLLQIIFTACINNAWWQRNVFLGSRDGEASDNNQSTLHSSLS